MNTLRDIIKTTLFEKRDNLKVFYDIDIFIQDFNLSKDDTPEENENNTDEVDANESIINEAIFKKNKNGVLEVSEEESQSILTLNDLVDFLNDKKIGGKNLLSPLASEILLIMGQSNDDDKTIEDVISEGDKIKILIDYGLNKKNSIGVFLNKKAGTNAISFLMRKDGKNLGPFNLNIFEQRLLMFSRM